MTNYESNFVRLLKEISAEEGIELTSYSYDWSFSLKKETKECYIVGYQFPLNLASARDVCQDKTLTYEVLKDHGIPAAVHRFLPDDAMRQYMTLPENEIMISEALREYQTIVLKDNAGTGGLRCFKVTNMEEAEAASKEIFSKSDAMALSPYYKIEEEYRVVMLDGQARLVIRKERQSVVGDGIHNVRELAESKGLFDRYQKELSEEQKQYVPSQGEKYYLMWKHNLGQGAYGEIVSDEALIADLEAFAKDALTAISMRFCSVDIIKVSGKFMILEINAGVMLEHFSGQNENTRHIAKEIYREAIRKSFEEKAR